MPECAETDNVHLDTGYHKNTVTKSVPGQHLGNKHLGLIQNLGEMLV